MKTTGEILKEKREKLEMTAEKLAELTSVTQAYVTMCENNKTKPSKAFLEKVKDILHLTETELNMIKEYEEFRRLPIKYQEKLMSFNNLDTLNFIQLESRGKKQFMELLEETTLMFDDESISLEDKEKMMLAIQEAFYDAKQKNKRKK